MKVTNEKTENSQVFLTVEMEPAEIEESMQNAYRKVVKQVNVPGFRKGKAPREILERYVGKDALTSDMLDDLVPKAYEKVIEEQEIEAIARPQIEIVETDPVIFKAVVPLKPVITLGDYHQIHLEPEKVEVTEEMVNDVVEQLRHQHATWEPVERSVAMNDLATLNIESTIGGESFISQEGAQYQLMADSVTPAPGFAKQLVGMSKDETKEFVIKYPDDYSRDEVAGKEVNFKVTVTEVKEENLPEVTDEFVSQVDSKYETIAAMKGKINEDLKARLEARSKQDFEERVMEAIVDISEVEYPPILVEAELHQLIDDQSRRLQMQGLTMEQYLQAMKKTEDEMHEELRPVAEKRVTRGLVLGQIHDEEKIEVTDEDVEAEITEMVSSAAENRREDMAKLLNTQEAKNSIRETLHSRRTVQRILEIAGGSEGAEASQKEETE